MYLDRSEQENIATMNGTQFSKSKSLDLHTNVKGVQVKTKTVGSKIPSSYYNIANDSYLVSSVSLDIRIDLSAGLGGSQGSDYNVQKSENDTLPYFMNAAESFND